MKLKVLTMSLMSALTLISAAPIPQDSSDIKDFSFVSLQNGETLSISYVASGCFHHESGVIDFTMTDVTYKGETKPLSLLQAKQLDNYFRLLSNRQGEAGGCTSSVDLNLTLIRNGEAITQTRLRDDFCFGFLETAELETDKILSPDHLKYDLFEREEAEQLSLIIEE